jgi:hypothetical protein
MASESTTNAAQPMLARHAPENYIDAREHSCQACPWDLSNAALKDLPIKRNDLGDVGNRRLGKAGLSRGEKDVASGARPLDLGSKWDTDDGGQRAAVQGVTLDDEHWSAKARARSDGLPEVGPPDLTLTDHHSELSRTLRAAC